jgi:hypothetical protein
MNIEFLCGGEALPTQVDVKSQSYLENYAAMNEIVDLLYSRLEEARFQVRTRLVKEMSIRERS